MKKILYITYDGITDPLGYSQVFRYLESLAKTFKIILISFEKKHLKETENFKESRKTARDKGIIWIPLTYHKSPTVPATLFDVLQGVLVSTIMILWFGINIVHVRSYVAGLMGWVLKKIFRLSFLFDMRGFWADERVEGGLWKKDARVYKYTKRLEKKFLLDADKVVSLTAKGKQVIEGFPYFHGKPKDTIEVIPTCADLKKFSPREIERKFGERFIVGYSGSVGLWYDFPASLRAFLEFKKSMADRRPLFLILNREEHEKIHKALKDFGLGTEDYVLMSATSDEMPYWLNQMDVNVYFIRPSFSKQASAPTKLGEILGCGKSVLTNDGVGDSGLIIRENQVGTLTNNFEESEIIRAVSEWKILSEDPKLASRCVETAKKYFSLEAGVKSYASIYNQL